MNLVAEKIIYFCKTAENKRLDFLRLWLSITQTEFLLEFVFVLMLSQVEAAWVSEELGGAVKQSLSF